jgi:dTDP-4-dehydrorhamnose reductase
VISNVLVTGGSGQIGAELRRLDWPSDVKLFAPTSEELDITDPTSVRSSIDALQPRCVVNLAAFTAVDRAEEEVAAAFLVNAQGTAYLAEAAARAGASIIHVSTDYVFDGLSDRPYQEGDETRPLSAYGASKLAGELAVRATTDRFIILRTAWVLSAHGHNFIKTMLRLAETHPTLRVVHDQIGCPTSAQDIATALQEIVIRALGDETTPWGTYHFVNAGEASWNELAQHIFGFQERRGAVRPQVEAISTSSYPTPARRPANSRLDTTQITKEFGIVPRPWPSAVDEILMELAAAP